MPGFASDYGNSQNLVEIEEVRDNTVILKNGGIRQILMVSGINIALKSEEEQNALSLQYQNFLNGLDFPLQIMVHSRKVNIENYLNSLEERKRKESSPLLQNQIEEYQKFIRGFVQENAIMQKIFLVVVPFTPLILPSTETVSKFISIPFLNKKPKVDEKKRSEAEREAAFQESLSQLAQRVNHIVDGLHTMGIETTLMNNEQLIELFYNLYNPESIEKEALNLPPTEAPEEAAAPSKEKSK